MKTDELIKALREIDGYPEVVELAYEAADRLQQMLDTATNDIKEAINADSTCFFCQHNHLCKGEKCPYYTSGVGIHDANGKYFDWQWSCMDFEFGTCDMLKDTPCNGCNFENNFRWKNLK